MAPDLSATLRELARYQKAAAPDEVAWVMAHTDFAALADEVERLAGLRTFAQHDALCSYRPTYPDAPMATCDCGFDAALAAAERPEEEPDGRAYEAEIARRIGA